MSPTEQSSRWQSKDVKIDKEQKKRRKFSVVEETEKKKERSVISSRRALFAKKKRLSSKSCLPRSSLVLINPPLAIDRDFRIRIQGYFAKCQCSFRFLRQGAHTLLYNTGFCPNRAALSYTARQSDFLRSRQAGEGLVCLVVFPTSNRLHDAQRSRGPQPIYKRTTPSPQLFQRSPRFFLFPGTSIVIVHTPCSSPHFLHPAASGDRRTYAQSR
jgi:hypothetical protein